MAETDEMHTADWDVMMQHRADAGHDKQIESEVEDAC